MTLPMVTASEIVQARGPRNAVDQTRPYAFMVEEERSASGVVEPVATLFLTNRECPFRCLYCDLWKNTTEVSLTPARFPPRSSTPCNACSRLRTSSCTTAATSSTARRSRKRIIRGSQHWCSGFKPSLSRTIRS